MNKGYLIILLFVLGLFSLQAQTLISSGKTASASSVLGGNTAALAFDADASTSRWECTHGIDASWLQVDLATENYISSVEITWEGAYAKKYDIVVSNDATFATGRNTIAQVINGKPGLIAIPTNCAIKGRYLRIECSERGSGYGYSIYDCKVYGGTTPIVAKVSFDIPYVQYLKIGFTPADNNGKVDETIQNIDKKFDLNFAACSQLKVSILDYRGDFTPEFWCLAEGSTVDTITGSTMIDLNVYNNMVIHFRQLKKVILKNRAPIADAGMDQVVTLPTSTAVIKGSNSKDADGKIVAYSWSQISGPNTATLSSTTAADITASNLILGDYYFKLTVKDDSTAYGTDDIRISVIKGAVIDFNLTTPATGAMVTNTRKPTLSWVACAGATNYTIYLNKTRNDYDWHASGAMLERYTAMGTTTATSYTIAEDLVDRWTYRWYVVATTASGQKYSNTNQFGLYIPTLETAADGVNIVNGCRDMNKNGTIEPFEDWHLTPEARLNDIMGRMTQDEKAKQLFYGAATAGQEEDGFAFSYGVEGGMTTTQYAAAKTKNGIPVAFMGDKIHGWKTIYPTQLGMAAGRDMDLVYQCGDMHRREQKSFGFTGTLTPLAEASTKVLYARIQEGSGENADEVSAAIRAILCGMQGGPEINPHSMLVTVKHWASQGAGGENDLQYDSVTIKYHMKPWIAAVEAGAASCMPGYNTNPYFEPGVGANNSKKGIDYLRNTIKWKGFVVTDWLASNTAQSAASLGAGIDVMGGAPSTGTVIADLAAGITPARIDESCRRVLDTKIRLGMFDNPYGDPTCTWNNATSHALALKAAKKSITLLTNKNGILPLKLTSGDALAVGGPRATWPGTNYDPNTIWQSIYYDDPQVKNYLGAVTAKVPAGVTVFADTSRAAVPVIPNIPETTKAAIVVIGEVGYTHGTEWQTGIATADPNIPQAQIDVIQRYHDLGIPVIVVILMPRPYILTPILSISDAIMLVYRGGTSIAEATASAIFGDFIPSGQLPFQLPSSMSQIGGDSPATTIEKWDLPYDLGTTATERTQIREYIRLGQPVPPIFGKPLFQYGYGLQNWVDPVIPPIIDSYNVMSSNGNVPAVYPNPFNENLTIDLPSTNDYTSFKIVDISGKVLYVKNINGFSMDINLSDKPAGVYFLTFEGGEKSVSYKLIKK